MAFIRLYRPDDEDAVLHVFRETAFPALKEAGDPALNYASHIWARPHLMLVSEHCRVIDDGTGRAVGYLLGVPDTEKFVADWKKSYVPVLESLGFVKPSAEEYAKQSSETNMALLMQRILWKPEWLLQEDFPNLLRQYPAHLHIDILPEYQQQGWGRKLVDLTIAGFRDMGVHGLHLGKGGENIPAGHFYAKLGFSRYPEVMDGGKSGEVGTTNDGSVILVRKF